MSNGNIDVQPVSSGDSQGRAGFERVGILKINRFIEVRTNGVKNKWTNGVKSMVDPCC